MGDERIPVLVWQLPPGRRVLASTVLGGGLGARHWVVNAQVPADYARTDPSHHLSEIARAAGCKGAGVGFMTAARVDRWTTGHDAGVEAYATVGLREPEWAASSVAPDPAARVGTINLVAFVPAVLTDAALVNAVATATEAKVQALLEAGIDGTGTASDAICIVAPVDGREQPFCGPRSVVGSALARAVHSAVSKGAS